jgi:hypothetical protein
MRLVDGNWKIVFDDQTKIVNTSAVKFNDVWKVEDTKIAITKTIVTKTNTNQTRILYPVANLSLNWNQPDGEEFGRIPNGNYNANFIEPEAWVGGHYNNGVNASWLEFDIKDNIPAGANIVSATLNLWPHLSTHSVAANPANADGADLRNHTAVDPHYFDPYVSRHNEALVGLETSTGITTSDWSTLDGTSNTTAQMNAFWNSTVWSGYTSRIRDTRKENSVCQIDMASIVAHGLTTPDTRFILRFYPRHAWHGTGYDPEHNSGRLCFWATDTLGGGEDVVFTKAGLGGALTENINAFAALPHNVAPTLTVNYNYCPSGSSQETDCDTTYCVTTSSTTNCISPIKDTTVNPYVYGILGNWRPRRSYVYYDNRTESDPSLATDIRKDGTITSYQSFWNFTSGKLSTISDSSKWIWNTESTLFNKRGLELENHNALNIYNSAQYGYNESLPIAVTQNASYREQAYEGFEDLKFPNAQNSCDSCAVNRHLDVEGIATHLSQAEAHTGKYSLFVSPGDAIGVYADVSAVDEPSDSLAMKLDTAVVRSFNISNSGTGLADTIYRYGSAAYTADNLGLDLYNYDNGSVSAYHPGVHNVNYDGAYPAGSSENLIEVPQDDQNYKVVWQGYFMADRDFNSILFSGDATNSLKAWMGGNLKISAFSNDPDGQEELAPAQQVYTYSKRGIIYPIRVEHTVGPRTGHLGLQWKNDVYTSWGLIPAQYLYPTLASAQAALNPADTTCVNWNGIIQKNLTYKDFSPVAGSRIVVSVWVKENQGCKCDTYKHASLQFNFRDQQGNNLEVEGNIPVYPTGNIIEGWQRIEALVTIPENASRIETFLRSNNIDGDTATVYFDDLRFHPFNSNMKSYVYDDLSLRLMAELDENNYASFYEYDDDGSLVRVKKETEEGVKTIKETRNALVKDVLP